MAVVDQSNLAVYCVDVARRAKAAAADLLLVSGAQKNDWLRVSAARFRERTAELQAANDKDLAAAPKFGLSKAQVDRLRLTEKRIDEIAVGLEEVAALGDPVGEMFDSVVRPNGLEVYKVRVPLGVVFFVYESRPNVTADAAAICMKSGNAVQLVSTIDREAVGNFLRLDEYIDVAIPRGGEGLIRRVADEATMPVIKHFSGNCHVFVDRRADLEMAVRIVVNSKCQRFGVCNACESLLVHADVAAELLPRVGAALAPYKVQIRGDERTCELLNDATAASEEDYAAEFLAPIVSVKVVGSLAGAIEHINHFGSGHTDSIVTEDLSAAREFVARVDSSAVMVNASTRFHDGGQFGLGAEIGISTDKFHARGPCGLRELTSYKYVVYGSGQVRE